MSRKAIVHIGPMKTGSSSIQSWLKRTRDTLHEAGFLVPAAIGAPNMSRLSYMAQVLAAGEELTPLDADRLTKLREEIAAQPASIHTVIFSGEMLGHQLKKPSLLRTFKAMLDEFFDDYTIILYLRRQDEMSLSRYSTSLRHGFKRAQPLSAPLDYETVLDPWSEVFGRDAMVARIFDRTEMPDGDVVQDFAEALGLPFVDSGVAPIARNSSLRPEAQVFLADLSGRVRRAGFSGVFMDIPGHDVIIRALGQRFRGSGTKPSRDDAIAFFDQMRESNERVRQAWFPERETLFSEDFSGYGEDATPEPTTEQVLDVAMSALAALVTKASPDGSSESAIGHTPRRDAREKKEMRLRRKEHRKKNGRRRDKTAETDVL